MVAYSLDQALQDIADLRMQLANLQQNLAIAQKITGPDGTTWTGNGIFMNGSQIFGEDTSPVAITGFASGWGNRGAGFPSLQIQRLAVAPGLAVIFGEITSPASGGFSNPSTFAGVGAAWQPVTEQMFSVRLFSNGTGTGYVAPAAGFLRGTLSTSGNMVISGVSSSSAQCGFQIFGLVSLTI
jgi:hypothetical protein